MKKILIMALTMASVLSAATCSEKNEAYSLGYISVSEQTKTYVGDNSASKKIRISAYVKTRCDGECKVMAMDPNSDDWSQKKYSACYDTCMKGAQDAFNGTKPKMKLCE